MAKPRPKAEVIRFPAGGRRGTAIDVRKLLLENQSTPQCAVPADLRKAIDARARELAEEAYALCREHLERRVGFEVERGQPRVVDVEHALWVIAQGDLGDALVRDYARRMRYLVHSAEGAAASSVKYAAELRELTQNLPGYPGDD